MNRRTPPNRRGGTLLGCLTLAGLIALTGAGLQDRNTACIANLKQMALALQMYSLDYDGKMPPMKGTAFQKPMEPYLRNRVIYTCPVTRTDYIANSALSGKRTTEVRDCAATVSFRDAATHPDRLWTVAYLDGHVKREKRSPVAGKK